MEQKINLDKFLGDLREELCNRNLGFLITVIDAALKQQHIGIYDGIVVEEDEQKPIISKFRIGDIITPKDKNEHYTITDIVDEWYEFREKHINGGIPIYYQDAWELVGQKPAENKGMNLKEEEMTPFQKKVFCIIDTTIEEEQGLKQVCDELLALASNENAWSEEDKKILKEVISNYESAYLPPVLERERILKELKSLRPKLHWKPSDEQMEALANALSLAKNCGEESSYDLRKLYEQLKKLRGE